MKAYTEPDHTITIQLNNGAIGNFDNIKDANQWARTFEDKDEVRLMWEEIEHN